MEGNRQPEPTRHTVEVGEVSPDSVSRALITSLEDGSLKLPFHSTGEYTERIMGFFLSLGRKWGYHAEDEYMSIDCSWILPMPETKIFELALEHENLPYVKEVLKSELPRLTHIKAHMKAIMFYPLAETVESDLERIARGVRNQDLKVEGERWLVITGSGDARDRKTWKKAIFRAFEIDAEGSATEIGNVGFDVKDISEKG